MTIDRLTESNQYANEGSTGGCSTKAEVILTFSSSVSGTVERLAASSGANVEPGDLLFVLETG